MINISFDVYGIPKAQPRPRAFTRKMGNKYVARVFEAGTAEGWKSLIAAAAKPHMPPTPILGPVRVDLTFFFPRPKSHFRTGKNEVTLRYDAPFWHTSKPDRDNLEKAVLDALTQLGGFWRDDSQVCDGRVMKLYRSQPGVMVSIGEKKKGMSTELEQLRARAEAAEQWQHTFAGLGGTPEIAWAFYKGLEDNKIAWQQRAEDAEARVAELKLELNAARLSEAFNAFECVDAQCRVAELLRDNDRLIEAGDLLVASESLEVGWHEAVAAWRELKEASQ